ncbi:response regulator transcription factor [Streptosporangiaceae bacterium NEAU-GS5]|nr:response regulator transcription factor [Streptosporangiaceae bacterium NEAU-GS5]
MRVMIAEDSGMLREMIAETLTSRGVEVTGQAGNVPELLRLIAADPPDVAVLDIRMPPAHRDEGIHAAEQIFATYPAVGVLVLSHYAETSYAVRLLEMSGRGLGYLVKDRVRDGEHLVDAIRRVALGEVVIDPDVIQRVLRRPRQTDPLARLSPAERQVLALLAEGCSNAAIARKLNYSVKTIEKWVTALSGKLGLPDSADAQRPEVNLRVLAVLTYFRTLDTGVEGFPSGT